MKYMNISYILFNISILTFIVNASPAQYKSYKKRGLPTLVTTTSTTSVASTTNIASSNTLLTSNSTNSNVTSYSNSTQVNNSSAITSIVRTTTSSLNYVSNPVTIPNNNQMKNPNIIIRTSTDGTVFISFASCLGLIILALFLTWGILAFKAWYSARHENHLKTMQDGYFTDPFSNRNASLGNGIKNSSNGSGLGYFGSDLATLVSSESESYDENEKNNDFGEKVLKTKSSRLSLYSLGSNSALNILNNFENSDSSTKTKGPVFKNTLANNSRLSMFISPTEILQNETHQWNNSANASHESFFSSDASTPTAHVSATSASQFISNDYSEFNRGNATTIDPIAAKNTKHFRPPSVHLDELLNLQDEDKSSLNTDTEI
ncbi:similar to Saccharomyces cerevisiae YOL007C CSI2 Protein of unknown function [Maudiozyma saulgeensis]|uniref:Uncharacterized protein n=1 Tax=Maudiozyma saulgeensis TaxID=1789683 RepID=A0A1X7QZP9_9SACH|nr:similar to Saccharomyces cerevisiae YOL007C CSI2 Protein of unknown function [Kazachstania saulgeensis]